MSLDLWLSVDTGAGEALSTESLNITHNVSPMWREARVFTALYESHGLRAGDFIDQLRRGIAAMESAPDVYRKLNPANGWGDYEGALRFLREWLQLCLKHPNATIGVSA